MKSLAAFLGQKLAGYVAVNIIGPPCDCRVASACGTADQGQVLSSSPSPPCTGHRYSVPWLEVPLSATQRNASLFRPATASACAETRCPSHSHVSIHSYIQKLG